MMIENPTVKKPICERDPRAVEHPAELVATVLVDARKSARLVGRAAEQMDTRRRQPLRALVASRTLSGSYAVQDGRRTAAQHDEHREDDQADAGVALPEDDPERVPPEPATSRSSDLAIEFGGTGGRLHQDGRSRGSR